MTLVIDEEQFETILRNPELLIEYPDLISTDIANIYTEYLMKKFATIDKKLHSPGKKNRNKGRKGEYLLCGIIDLTIWRFRYKLDINYEVEGQYNPHPANNQGALDFRLNLNNQIFLCEAKNWGNSFVDQTTYDEKIKSRFIYNGINVLSFDKYIVDDVLIYAKIPINFIALPNFMDAHKNIFDDIRDNIVCGVYQFTDILEKHTTDKRKNMKFTLQECLQMGMPTWFIEEYCNKDEKRIDRMAKNLV